MRTEADLRAALAMREEVAVPEPAAVLAGVADAVQRQRRRHTAAVVAATVAAVTAVMLPAAGLLTPSPQVDAGATPVVGARQPGTAVPPTTADPADPAATVDRPPFAFTIRAATVAGYDISPLAVTPAYQIASVRAPGGQPHAVWLVVYQPGAQERVVSQAPGYDLVAEPEPTSVGGAAAWFSTQGERSALRWEYAPGGFAVIGSWGQPPLDEPALRELAEAVPWGVAYPARVPYRLTYLPAGLALVSVAHDLDADVGLRSAVQLLGDAGGLDITVGDDAGNHHPDGEWQESVIGGHPARCAVLIDGRRCLIDVDGLAVSVGVSQLDDSQLHRLIAGMTVANRDDPASWYELPIAIPIS